jgi:hypothetical protein
MQMSPCWETASCGATQELSLGPLSKSEAQCVVRSLFTWGEDLLFPRQTPKLKDHPLSVLDCLFKTLAATNHVRQLEDAPCRVYKRPPLTWREHNWNLDRINRWPSWDICSFPQSFQVYAEIVSLPWRVLSSGMRRRIIWHVLPKRRYISALSTLHGHQCENLTHVHSFKMGVWPRFGGDRIGLILRGQGLRGSKPFPGEQGGTAQVLHDDRQHESDQPSLACMHIKVTRHRNSVVYIIVKTAIKRKIYNQ